MTYIVILFAALIGTLAAPNPDGPYPFTLGQEKTTKAYHDLILAEPTLMEAIQANCEFGDFLERIFVKFYVDPNQTANVACALGAAAAQIVRALQAVDNAQIAREAAASDKFNRKKCVQGFQLASHPNAPKDCPKSP